MWENDIDGALNYSVSLPTEGPEALRRPVSDLPGLRQDLTLRPAWGPDWPLRLVHSSRTARLPSPATMQYAANGLKAQSSWSRK